MPMTGKCELCERGGEADTHADELLSEPELRSSGRREGDSDPSPEGLVLLACLQSQATLWLLK